jgi:hypothetical protein
MAHVIYMVETDLDPDTVWSAFIEFGPRRTEIFPDISPGSYQLLERGEGWARVRESTDSLRIWSVERYEWRKPIVTTTSEDSNVIHPGGTWKFEILPRGGGGTVVRAEMDRHAKGLRGHLLHAAFQGSSGRVLAARMQKMLKGLEARSKPAGTSP